MSSNHGKLGRDLIGGSLQIHSKMVIDSSCNAKVKNLDVTEDVVVKGNITAENITAMMLCDCASVGFKAAIVAGSNIMVGSDVPYTEVFNSAPGSWSGTAWTVAEDGTYVVTWAMATLGLTETRLRVNGVDTDNKLFGPTLDFVSTGTSIQLNKDDVVSIRVTLGEVRRPDSASGRFAMQRIGL